MCCVEVKMRLELYVLFQVKMALQLYQVDHRSYLLDFMSLNNYESELKDGLFNCVVEMLP